MLTFYNIDIVDLFLFVLMSFKVVYVIGDNVNYLNEVCVVDYLIIIRVFGGHKGSMKDNISGCDDVVIYDGFLYIIVNVYQVDVISVSDRLIIDDYGRSRCFVVVINGYVFDLGV